MVEGRRDLTMGGPSVRFGTKCPSITSMCSMSAPRVVMREASEPRREKSEERREGQILVGGRSRGIVVLGGALVIFREGWKEEKCRRINLI